MSDRPDISDGERLRLWVAAGGRCTLCNELVIEDEVLGTLVPIGEMAHNVGWGPKSPRGEADLAPELRQKAENLLLLCRNCHKSPDHGGHIGVFTVEWLNERKTEREAEIRFLTGIDPARDARVIRMVGRIRDDQPQLSRHTVLAATVAEGYFPRGLAGEDGVDIDINLRDFGEEHTPDYFARCLPAIAERMRRVHDGVRREQIKRVAIFAFARIPLLIELGARLSDKVEALIFERHRNDDSPWNWPNDPAAPAQFECSRLQDGAAERVVLLISQSGSVPLADVPGNLRDGATVYEIRPLAPATAKPGGITSRAALTAFEQTVREFLGTVERAHPGARVIDLFPAVGLAAAVTLGRVLLPGVDRAWGVFDRDGDHRFFKALEVKA